MKSNAQLLDSRLPGVPTSPANLEQRLRRLAHRVVRGGSRRLLRYLGLGPPILRYADWIRNRLAERLIDYPPVTPPVTFSILTPVHNTAPTFLRDLAESVLSQDDSVFEWVVVDNGSTRRGTRRILRRLERQPCVRLLRLNENRGIVRGTRAALEAAAGDYIVPVDHDDLLYPDALRVLAHFIRERGDPAVLYSDEDKLLRGRPACPFFKPDWDPALFLNCCYVTHLSAFQRMLALELEAYTDPVAEGCPDWDTHCRFVRAGYTPVHVPEVLYSWRVHAGSTSSIESGAKRYAIECQEKVLRNHIARQANGSTIELRTNPLFDHAGMWWPARRRTAGPTLHVRLVTAGDPERLSACLQTLGNITDAKLRVLVIGTVTPAVGRVMEAATLPWPIEACPWKGRYSAWLGENASVFDEGDIIVTWRDDCVPIGEEWPWEITGLFELHDEAVAVSGRVCDAAGILQQAGEAFGYCGLSGSPIVGPHFPPSGYHGLLFCQRSVSVVTPVFFAARAGFLANAFTPVADAPGSPVSPSWEMLGLWLGAHARQSGKRILYSPHIACQQCASPDWPQYRTDDEVLVFLQQHADLLVNDPYYGRHFSLAPGEGYLLTTPKRRDAILLATLSRLQGLARANHENLASPEAADLAEVAP
jgi:glycosyl transferase family 2